MNMSKQDSTRIDEIAKGIYRISTPVPPEAIPGGFTFNQYLIVDDAPLLHHTGPLKMFPLIREAIASVIPVESLRYISFSHYEADECGSLNEFLELAPKAEPLCSRIAKMVSVDDVALRPAHALGDSEELSLGSHVVRWIDTPHLPHAWECGHLFETTTKTLFCGDLFTQGGAEHEPLTTDDILESSEAMRGALDYFSQTRQVHELMEKLAATSPQVLACMHGSAWQGDGAALLRLLAGRLAA
jgi:flavorubredoxin